jgi:hypothetical protein
MYNGHSSTFPCSSKRSIAFNACLTWYAFAIALSF